MKEGIACQAGCSMPHPLAYHKNRCLDMKLEHDHFKWRRVLVPHQISNQPAVLAHGLGALSVGDPRRLYDALVAAHVVHQAHEAIAGHLQLLVK